MNKLKTIFKSKNCIAWSIVTVVLAAFLITLTILEHTMLYSIFGTVLGGPIPVTDDRIEKIYESDYNSKEDATAAGAEVNLEIAREGFILLLNENNALPIATPSSSQAVTQKPRVSVFGKNSVDLVLGGSGSGGISGEAASTIYDGLEAGGFEVNPVLKEFYEGDASGSGRSGGPDLGTGSSSAPTLDIGETPVNMYTSEVRESFGEYNDAAIVVISRLGGESWDLPRFQNTANGGVEGSHYLQLDNNEYAMLDMVTSRFDKVIVVLNTLTSFQCDFIDRYNNTANNKRIDAVVWIGGPGVNGAEAIGDFLNGNVNPSGRTTDIYSRDFTKDPTWQNFGDNSQVNGGKDASAYLENNSAVAGQYMVAYEEGIYVGYRYYETRAYEEKLVDPQSEWYEENVIFPFGYGLSYTTFEQEIAVEGNLEDENSTLTVKVTSTNIGDVPGKDVIQLYVSLPYIRGGIEKSYIQLVDFAKTPVLENGKSYTAMFTVDVYDLASYDYNDANANDFKGYELDPGQYTFFASANSHVDGFAYDSASVSLDKNIQFAEDPQTGVEVVNRYTTEDFNDIQYRLADVYVETQNGEELRKGMSRTDFEGTFPQPFTEEERKVMTINGVNESDVLSDKTHNNTAIASIAEQEGMPELDKDVFDIDDGNGGKRAITLRDLIGADYNDDDWQVLLDRLTFNEMLELVNNGAFQTAAILSIDKNLTNDSDGPVGFVNFMPGKSEAYKGNATFATEIVIGSTWNKDLAYQMGKMVGENGLWGDVNGNGLPYSGWYAPAVNLHRSPFGGRNFEYYSEDPVLSGKLAVNVINGARTKGVYTDLKHFALNDQETNRAGISTFCTEQALRELYLKPFEIAVKGDDDPAEVASAKQDGVEEYKGSMGIMSSFNRIGTKWTGGDYRLLTEILRGEWGFEGLVICDYKTSNSVMDSRQMLYAGNDLILTSMPEYMWQDASSSSAEDVNILRQAAHNILYTVANSNSVNVKVIGYRTEWWITATIVVDCVAFVGLAVWGFFAIRGALRKQKTSVDVSGKDNAE